MRSAKFFFLSLAVLLIGCTQQAAPEFSDADRTRIAAEVQARLDGYCPAVVQGDSVYLNGFWADHPNFVFAGDGELHLGYGYIQEANQDFFDNVAEVFYCTMPAAQVHVFGPEAASLATEYAWGMVTTQGDTVESHGSWVYVFGQVGEEWRVVHSAGTHLYD